MDRVRFLDMSKAVPRDAVIAQHAIIVDAIKAGDASAAEKAMRLHLSEILRSLPELAAEHPDLFELETEAQPEMLSA
jgi:DNA-binding GntR family transcriptional regulator